MDRWMAIRSSEWSERRKLTKAEEVSLSRHSSRTAKAIKLNKRTIKGRVSILAERLGKARTVEVRLIEWWILMSLMNNMQQLWMEIQVEVANFKMIHSIIVVLRSPSLQGAWPWKPEKNYRGKVYSIVLRILMKEGIILSLKMVRRIENVYLGQ